MKILQVLSVVCSIYLLTHEYNAGLADGSCIDDNAKCSENDQGDLKQSDPSKSVKNYPDTADSQDGENETPFILPFP